MHAYAKGQRYIDATTNQHCRVLGLAAKPGRYIVVAIRPEPKLRSMFPIKDAEDSVSPGLYHILESVTAAEAEHTVKEVG